MAILYPTTLGGKKMVEKTMKLFTENLARAMDRRSFLKRTSEAAFLSMAALAAGRLTPALAAAGVGSGGAQAPSTPSCSPPGPYCNLNGVNEPNGCHGASCFQLLSGGTIYQCQVYYTYYSAGCWTTAATGGYWSCCDCRCGGGVATCGCA